MPNQDPNRPPLYPQAPAPVESEETMPAQPGGVAPKRIVAIAAVLVAVVIGYKVISGPSKTMAGWITDYSAGVRQATESKKPMLVLFTADWCPPCQQLKADVWTDADASKRLGDQFTLVKVDLTQQGGENGEIAQTYAVRGIPTVIVFGANGQQVDRRAGGGDKESVMAWLDRAHAKAK